ncbi:PREDICTED: uncharacterized protein LOC109165318 [Ipomoea nil]|uniref:uncharacterized protein LOC109165318 n=1 Tax=Ipomoea nil TaxID=35883 RepID=UPI000901582E|nr:PREDICTED: uncharacterized protein LOC109165318 [Ipomoea nil]
MASERRSYAAAISGVGEASPSANATTPINGSQIPAAPGAILQENQRGRPQRNLSIEDQDNPLLLTVNDSPSIVLVNPPLSGSSNYNSWCISMRIALEVKNKWGLINGDVEPLSRDHPQYSAWRRCNLLVCSWLFKSVHPQIAQSIMHLENGKDIWEDLRRRFSQRDAQRISILQNDIYNMKQGSLSVNDYYTKSRTLWEEMNNLRPIPVCKCTCNLVDEIRKEREVDQVIRFLQGLNDDYSTLKSHVLVLDPLPEVYKVFVMAEKLERQINLTNLNLESLDSIHSNAVHDNQGSINGDHVGAVLNNFNGKRNNASKPKCTFCGMLGHTVDKCYKKHGYPPGWIPGYKSKGKQVAAMNTNGTDLGVTAEQMQKIMAFIESQSQSAPKVNTSAAVALVPKFDEMKSTDEGKYITSPYVNSVALCSASWIIDSGATNHIVCSSDFLTNCHKVDNVAVNLPTGQRVSVEHIGDIELDNGLWLREALHIPLFKFNIISVSKLLKDTTYTLTFVDGQCLIQGIGVMAGLAKEEGGLYLLKKPPKKSGKGYSVYCRAMASKIRAFPY